MDLNKEAEIKNGIYRNEPEERIKFRLASMMDIKRDLNLETDVHPIFSKFIQSTIEWLELELSVLEQMRTKRTH